MAETIFGVVDFNKNLSLYNSSKFLKNHYEESTNYNLILSQHKNQKIDIDGVIVSFYGSIYNADNLKEELKISADIEDFELIVYVYKTYGIKFLEKIDGIFSIIIYDKHKHLLYFARDRAGIYPLYFYAHNEMLIFGSSLKEFSNLPGFTKKIDKNGLALYLTYGYILQPYTIYEHTYKVKSGHYAVYDLKKRVFEQNRYWSLESCYLEKKDLLKESEVINSTQKILQDSIKKRLNSKQNFASSLSGGYDSSIVAALLSEQSSQKLDTFTIGFDDTNINEAPYAKKIAAALGTNHHEHYFSTSDALKIVPKLCQVYDEPFADYAATPTVLMTQLVNDCGFDTLFVGDGGDEVFATADDAFKLEQILNFPNSIKSIFYKTLNTINYFKLPTISECQDIPTKYYKLLKILNASNIPQMIKVRNVLFNESQIEKLLNSKEIFFKTTFDEIEFPSHSEVVDQVIGTYFKTSMVDGELVKSFQAARFANIKVKEPLLDLDLINYFTRVPQILKIKEGEKKYILKQIAHRYIPKNLLNRPKSGFDIPFSFWLKEPLKDLLFEQINETRLKDDGIFDVQAVLTIRDSFYAGKDQYKYKLWTIFIFQLWLQEIKE